MRLALALCLLTAPAYAEAPCAEHDKVAAMLESQYGEIPFATGTVMAGAAAEFYRNDTTGTWTLLVIRPDGLACIAAAGEAFAGLAPKPNI